MRCCLFEQPTRITPVSKRGRALDTNLASVRSQWVYRFSTSDRGWIHSLMYGYEHLHCSDARRTNVAKILHPPEETYTPSPTEGSFRRERWVAPAHDRCHFSKYRSFHHSPFAFLVDPASQVIKNVRCGFDGSGVFGLGKYWRSRIGYSSVGAWRRRPGLPSEQDLVYSRSLR